jgi:hypothetical protein
MKELPRFIAANNKIIQKYTDKIAANKKPKFKPSDKLAAITEVMEKIMKLFDDVEIKT